jgi:predicted transcriptional regulator
MNFRKELETYLKEKKVKPFHLSKRAGVAPSIISLFLSGKRGLNLKSVEKQKDAMKW